MPLDNIELHNFRRYEQAWFRLHPNFTVLIGDNGMGKTTVLDAIAILLGTYFQGSGIKAGQRVIRKEDARLVCHKKGGQTFLERQTGAYLTASANFRKQEIQWRRDVGDRGGKAKELVGLGASDREKIKQGADNKLPLFLYYGSGRLWDTHRDVKTAKPGSRLDAYRYCLDPKSDQKAFERWFKRLTYAELQKRKQIPALRAVESAVKGCVPEAEEFYHDTDEDQIMIDLGKEGLVPFNYLSDGYRNMVAMVADIAYRASLLNAHLEAEAATQTPGVVLIDEIDLHLHPKWQRRIVRDLQRTFPEIQFVATTHSPFIIQSLDPGEVIDLNGAVNRIEARDGPEGIASPGPANAYSDRSPEDIVEEVMGVPVPQRSQRLQEMYDVAKEYYRLLQGVRQADARTKQELKTRLDELSAPFSDNVAYHAFLEMERLAAFGEGSTREEHP